MSWIPPAGRAFLAALVLPVFGSLSACSGPRPAEEPDTTTVAYPVDAEPTTPTEPALPAEPAPSPETTYEPLPAQEPEPDAGGVTREVAGYRVQVYASNTAAGADEARGQAEAWWADEQRRGAYTAPFDAYVVSEGGLYKVRMGAFTSREDAEQALAVARTRFPDAFLVPDRVAVDD